MNIAKRVGALEGKAGHSGFENVLRIFQRVGQAEGQAFDDYGRERIGPNDFVIIRRSIASPFRDGGLS